MKVHNSRCLKPCSGLIVTSFDQNYLMNTKFTKYFPSIHDERKKELAPLINAYHQYKKITQYPTGYNSKYKEIK